MIGWRTFSNYTYFPVGILCPFLLPKCSWLSNIFINLVLAPGQISGRTEKSIMPLHLHPASHTNTLTYVDIRWFVYVDRDNHIIAAAFEFCLTSRVERLHSVSHDQIATYSSVGQFKLNHGFLYYSISTPYIFVAV